MAEHTVEIIALRRADLFGHRHVAARCSCGWQGDPRAGRNATEHAQLDGEAHVRSVEE